MKRVIHIQGDKSSVLTLQEFCDGHNTREKTLWAITTINDFIDKKIVDAYYEDNNSSIVLEIEE